MNGNTRFDWEKARARLAKVGESLQKSGLRSAEERDRVYRMRAELLARPVSSQHQSAGERILIFHLGSSRYAVPLSGVSEVLPGCKPAPAPGTPAELAGLIQVRGEVRPVWNLRRMLGLPDEGEDPSTAVLLLNTRFREIGVLVEMVEDIRTVTPDERRLAPQTFLKGDAARHTAWLTEDLIVVLNIDSLFEKQTEGR